MGWLDLTDGEIPNKTDIDDAVSLGYLEYTGNSTTVTSTDVMTKTEVNNYIQVSPAQSGDEVMTWQEVVALAWTTPDSPTDVILSDDTYLEDNTPPGLYRYVINLDWTSGYYQCDVAIGTGPDNNNITYGSWTPYYNQYTLEVYNSNTYDNQWYRCKVRAYYDGHYSAEVESNLIQLTEGQPL